MITYTYKEHGHIRCRKFHDVRSALQAAANDIERNDGYEPEYISDEYGNVLYTDEQIGEKFVMCEIEGEPEAPSEPAPKLRIFARALNVFKRREL